VKNISDLGERKAIQLIANILSKGEVAVGIGDDCAAFEFGDEYLLVSTDMISEKNHIPPVMKPWQIGWFIVAINLSDLAAKGGRPLGLVLSLGLPKKISEQFLKELIRGADDCAKFFRTSIVGGDTKESEDVTICGAILGRVKKNEFMSRRGAKPGDVVAVTGTLGKAGAGYYALKYGKQDKKLLKGLLEPIPRIKEGRMLAKEKFVTACMDISDGLSSSLYQLQTINNVGFAIEKEKIPISQMLLNCPLEKELEIYEYALHFGGDYELLLTLPSDTVDQAITSVARANNCLTIIGKVTKEDKITLIKGKRKKILPDRGYEHFSRNNLC
jgi:thiamine-monophosphate kinase